MAVMSIRMTKDWRPLTPANVATLDGQLGVFQLADADQRIFLIGFAGGRSLFGLKGELNNALEELGDTVLFRVEINSQYASRYEELLMIHLADYGVLPEGNTRDAARKIGRLSPS
jgi:hypothetical protein